MAELSSSIDILKKAHLLELVSKKNSVSLLDGQYRTQIPGRGTEFKEARKYVSGESIRLIDWNMTARLGEPYVKIFQEERERNIIIALDISPSMYTGWQESSKISYAVEVAATLAYSTVATGDRLGLILFQDQVVKDLPCKRGKRQLYQALYHLVSARDSTAKVGKTDIRSAIHAIQKQKGKRFVVFLISDFIDLDIPEDLRYLMSSHDLALLHIYDPFEFHKPRHLRFLFQDPEDPTHIESGTTNGYKTLESFHIYLKHLSNRYGLSWDSFPTNLPPHSGLARFFHKKKGIGR